MTAEEAFRPITWQDVRLGVGEGPLTPQDVLAGANAEMTRRARYAEQVPGVWRCGIADVIGMIDAVLTMPLQQSRRKAEREIGDRLHNLMEGVFKARGRFAPTDYEMASEAGKEMAAAAVDYAGEEVE